MKQVIILRNDVTASGDKLINVALWLPVIAGREVPNPSAQSNYAGRTTDELASLQAGTVIEKCFPQTFSSSATVSQIKTALEAQWTAKKAELDAQTNPNQYYGTSWNGTTWS